MIHINYALSVHKIFTVWTKFLNILILWMLLSKENIIQEKTEQCLQNSNHLLINSSYNNQEYTNHTSSIIIKYLKDYLPNMIKFNSKILKDVTEHNHHKKTISNSSEHFRIPYDGEYLYNILWISKNIFTTFGSVGSQKLPEFTTENGIFTGLPPPTPKAGPPLGDFDVSINETFGTFMNLQISWKSKLNISKIELRYVNFGGIIHTVEITTEFLVNDIINIFPPESGRVGFIYKLGGLQKSKRYYLQAWAFADSLIQPIYDKQSFLTDIQDMHDRIYNMNGIFMVLGISTILMTIVMGCVGYEKLIHQKKRALMDICCCRRDKPKKNRIHDSGGISPEPLTRSHGIHGLPDRQDEYVRSTKPNRSFAF